jgi:hypothetical protein
MTIFSVLALGLIVVVGLAATLTVTTIVLLFREHPFEVSETYLDEIGDH